MKAALLLALGSVLGVSTVWAAPPPISAPSTITVVFKVPWSDIVTAADTAMPRCGGASPACEGTEADGHFILQREGAWDNFGSVAGKPVGFKGSVWRWDPVQISYSKGMLSASQHVLYHVKLGWGGNELAKCGYNEPPREMTVSLGGSISISPNWYVASNLSGHAEPDNLCKVSTFDIDVTLGVTDVVNRALDKASKKMNVEIQSRTNIKQKAAELWAKLQQPIEIGKDTWLSIRPAAAFAGPLSITDDGQYLSLPVALQVDSEIAFGTKPPAGSIPLPPLTIGSVAQK